MALLILSAIASHNDTFNNYNFILFLGKELMANQITRAGQGGLGDFWME
jgi:hypothetical protein